MNYFQDCLTTEDAKKLYRELAKKYHPDTGGSKEQFQDLKAQYEAFSPYKTHSFSYSDFRRDEAKKEQQKKKRKGRKKKADTHFSFGKHKGESIEHVGKTDMQYLEWVAGDWNREVDEFYRNLISFLKNSTGKSSIREMKFNDHNGIVEIIINEQKIINGEWKKFTKTLWLDIESFNELKENINAFSFESSSPS